MSATWVKNPILCPMSLLFLLATTSFNAPLHADDRYAVTFSRPYLAGQQYRVDLSAESKRTQQLIRRNQTESPEVELRRIHLTGVMAVQAVNAHGEPQVAQYHIASFQAEALGTPVQGLSAGDTLQVRLEGNDTRYYVDETPLPDALSELLGFVIRFRGPDLPRETSPFAIDAPQQVGARWPVDSEQAAASLSRDQVRVAPEAVSGEAALVEVLEREGRQAYRIQGDVQVSRLEMDLPRMARLDSAAMTMQHDGIYPVDTAIQPLETEVVVDIEARARGAGLVRFLRFLIREERTVRVTLTPIVTGGE